MGNCNCRSINVIMSDTRFTETKTLKVESADKNEKSPANCQGLVLGRKEIISKFCQVLQFFEVQSSGNPFKDIYSIFEDFDDRKFFIRITKIIFDYYDENSDKKLDLDELERFFADIYNLLGYKVVQNNEIVQNDTYLQLKSVLEEKKEIDEFTFECFLNLNILDNEIKKNLEVLIVDDENHLDLDLKFANSDNHQFSEEERRYLLSLNLKSNEIINQFKFLFDFFEIKQTPNFLRNVFKIRQLFMKEDSLSLYQDEILDSEDRKKMEKKVFQKFFNYIFKFYDTNLDGFLTKAELFPFMVDLYETIPSHNSANIDIKELVDIFIVDLDQNKDNLISYDELKNFIPVMFSRIHEENKRMDRKSCV